MVLNQGNILLQSTHVRWQKVGINGEIHISVFHITCMSIVEARSCTRKGGMNCEKVMFVRFWEVMRKRVGEKVWQKCAHLRTTDQGLLHQPESNNFLNALFNLWLMLVLGFVWNGNIFFPSLFDDPETRYKKLKKTASQFLISQFGMCHFNYLVFEIHICCL